MRVSQNFIENISNNKKLKYYVEDDIYALKIIFRILYQNQLEGNIGKHLEDYASENFIARW